MAKRHPGARGGDGGDAVCELVVEAAEEADDEVGVGDGSTDVAEGVGQDLELAAVLRDRHVPLVKPVELLTSLDGAIHDVVEELVGDGGPGGVGVVGRLDDGGEEVGGERGVEPGDNASIDLRPHLRNAMRKKVRHVPKLESPRSSVTGTWDLMLIS